jgi:hypothetical protein
MKNQDRKASSALARVFVVWRLYQLSFMVGVALGPAVGGVLLATSPIAIWWSAALAMALTGAGFLGLGGRVLDPLDQAAPSGLASAPEVA